MKSIQQSVAEEREQFACAQAGCHRCVDELLRRHRKLVVAVVRRQWLGERATFADLVQEGNVALWRAIMGFDPERGVAFSTYAWRAIERAVWAAVARAERTEGWQAWEKGEELAVGVGEQEERREEREVLLQMVGQLPARQAAIMRALYGLEDGEGRTLAAVGQRYGLTAERVRQIRNDALLQLRLPGMSSALRQLLAADDRAAYQQAQQLNRRWLRQRRGRQR